MPSENGGLDALAKLIKDAQANPQPFKIHPIYNAEADSIAVYLENERGYSEWATPYVSVFRSRADNRIIGFEIDAVSHLMKETTNEPS